MEFKQAWAKGEENWFLEGKKSLLERSKEVAQKQEKPRNLYASRRHNRSPVPKERKGKERKGKEREGKERNGAERNEKERKG